MKRPMVICLVFLLLSLIAIQFGCMPGDPIDDWYTKNVYPGFTDTSDIGSDTLRYDEGYFRNISLTALPVYANNAAAMAGGLVAGDLYRTGSDPDLVCVVH